MKNQTSAYIFWMDGKKLSGRKHKIFLDNNAAMNVVSNSGTLADGRPVKLVDSRWIIVDYEVN